MLLCGQSPHRQSTHFPSRRSSTRGSPPALQLKAVPVDGRASLAHASLTQAMRRPLPPSVPSTYSAGFGWPSQGIEAVRKLVECAVVGVRTKHKTYFFGERPFIVDVIESKM